jgi:lactoylglutathione lyase
MSVSMNKNVAEESTTEAQYRTLAPFFYLEAGWTGSLGPSRPVEEPRYGPRHDVTILAVKDINRSVAFYSEAFGWSVSIHTKRYVEFGLPGGRGLALCRRNAFTHETGAVVPESSTDATSGVQVYLRCDDLPRVIARLHTAGARALSKVRERDWGEEVAYFADPDGHVIAVARPVKKR